MSPSSGKLSSVLAAFETTIQKNKENTTDGSCVASNSGEHRTRTRRRRHPDEQPIMHEEREKTSPTQHSKRSAARTGEASSSRKTRRSRHASDSSSTTDKAPLSPIRNTKLGEAYCSPTGSPTEETTDASYAGILFETSSPSPRNIHKMPNSLKRQHSGEILIAAAQKAVSKFSPRKGKTKKLNASLPIMGNLANCDFSFSSLPVILPKHTSSPQRTSPTTEKGSSLQTKSQNRSIAANAFGKSYPKSPIPRKGKLKTLQDFDKDVSFSDTDTPSVYTYDLNRNSIKPKLPRLPSHDETYYPPDDPVVQIVVRPKSILLQKHHPINRVRRVKFLDLQPGGGRRMSLEPQHCRDSQPLRPRRASLTIRNEVSGGTNNVTKLAATKIQASIRGYLQWTRTRAVLLERRLRRIESDHFMELQMITEHKWLGMDALRNAAVEEEKELDSQVELGNKLMEHLKRDSALVRGQTKQLREHCKTLRESNAHCEQMAQIQSESVVTLQQSLEQLQQQYDHIKQTEADFAINVQRRTKKLSLVSQEVKFEFDCKKLLKKTTKKLVSTVRQRCQDDSLIALVSTLALGANSDEPIKQEHGSSLFTPLESPPSGGLLITVPNLDEQSFISDITEHLSIGTVKAVRNISSGGNSFAEYDPALVSPTPQTMPMIVE